MIRALKVVMIVFGVVGILMGLLLVFSPDKLASTAVIGEMTGYLKYTMATLGYLLIAPSVFLIVAARDPLRHINWVKFAIV
jgi:vacuolar-type H+-ATPase subunit I/STV1